MKSPRPDPSIAAAGLLAVVGALLLIVALALESRPTARLEWGLAAVEREYAALYDELDLAATRAQRAVAELESSAAVAELFRVLEAARAPGLTLLLVDGGGEPIAWAGPGLRHTVTADGDPRMEELGFVGGFTSVTLYAAESFADVQDSSSGPQSRAVLAARSLTTTALPFERPPWWSAEPIRWGLRAPGGAELVSSELDLSDYRSIVVDGLPELRISEPRLERSAATVRIRRIGLALVAIALLLLAVRQRALPQGRAFDPLDLGIPAGLLLAGVALGLPMRATFVAMAGAVAVLIAVRSRRALRELVARGWVTRCVGLVAGLGAVAASWWIVPSVPRAGELAERLGGNLEGAFALSGLWGLLFSSLLALSSFRARLTRRGFVPCVVFAGLWLLTLLLSESPVLCAAAFCLAMAVGSDLARRDEAHPVTLAVLALVLSSSLWELATRTQLKRQLDQDTSESSILTVADQAALREEIESSITGLDLAALVLGDPDAVAERQDLAYAVWSSSALRHLNGLSGLVVLPGDGMPTTFSFGLPVDSRGELAREPERWPRDDLRPWIENDLIRGSLTLRAARQEWGLVRYWFVPLLGSIRSGNAPDPEAVGHVPSGEVGVELLDATLPANVVARRSVGAGAVFELFSPRGDALLSDWGATFRLSCLIEEEGCAPTVETPRGRHWIWTAETPQDVSRPSVAGATRVILLPRVSAVATAQRVGVVATNLAAVLLLVAALFGGLALGSQERRQRLVHVLRGYSFQLVLLLTALAIGPLLLLNAVTFNTLSQRVQSEHRANAERALDSVQKIIADYIPGLAPGTSISDALDDELMSWFASVVQHDVNLYWRGSVTASSKPELFAAGLLPKRIPGDIYAALGLEGLRTAARTARIGGQPYLELFAPVQLPGEPSGSSGLFVSVPLLGQQREAARELGRVGRNGIVLSAALLLLLFAVATRFARGFLRPISELVRGTGRIAAGEERLGIRPSEPQLQELARAIDTMAERIAHGRRQIVTEKRVVEAVIDNVTSAVISLDDGDRVVLRNRVAKQLLDVDPGDRLTRVADHSSDPRWTAILEVLGAPAGEVTSLTTEIEVGQESRNWNVIRVPVRGQPPSGAPSALLVVEDVTDVVRGQRLEAWAEMARLIAHEIKNPLTPIRLSTDHLRQVYAEAPERLDEIFDTCTRNILDQVDELSATAAEFSNYARIPAAVRRRNDLVDVVRNVVEAYQRPLQEGDGVVFDSADDAVVFDFDARLIGRVVRNLMENALSASADQPRVEVAVLRSDREAIVEVRDRGSGVPPEDLGRIFEPYFSTSVGGSGLGLAISKRIVEDHSGSVAARNRPGGGLVVRVVLPVDRNSDAVDADPSLATDPPRDAR